MGRIKNILKYIASVFLVLLVSLCIYTFVVTDIMKKDYVNVFGYTYFVVASGSMSGTIEVDDIIFVRLTKDVKPNDIITFKSKDGDIITHRLIEKDGSNYITKGDVNNVTDEAVSREQIIGKVSSIVSPSFILKSIAVFLIVFIFLALVNFDGIVQKYIVKGDKPKEKLPEDIFSSSTNRVEEPSSGLTQTIALKDMEKLEKAHEREVAEKDNIEVLDFTEYLFDEDIPRRKKNINLHEKETVDLVVAILKCKKNQVAKARMNKKWLLRYQYVYKLCQLLLIRDTDVLIEEINSPSFQEIFDYDLERVGLTETIRNRIYDMPIYVFLRILTYSILYNDDEMFDGVYKILKYKTMVDKEHMFCEIPKSNTYAMKQLKVLVSFMQKVSDKFDNKKVFDLDKIERMVKIGNY